MYLGDNTLMGRPELVHSIILRSNLKTRQTLLTILQRVFHCTVIAKLSSEYHALWCT